MSSLDLRLEDSRRLANLADGSTIPLVEAGASLLGLAELCRIDRLQELVPAQMDIEVRPVDERTVGVDREVSDRGIEADPLRAPMESSGTSQHPVFRASDEERGLRGGMRR